MRTLLCTAFLLISAVAEAQIFYKCPEVYPEKKSQSARLTNATMYFGELHGNGAMHGDVAQVKGGTDIRFGFPDDMPKWLVCQYGGKRISGTSISGAQVIGGRELWIQLDRFIDVCDLKIRETPAAVSTDITWTATATCKSPPPPPPDMYECNKCNRVQSNNGVHRWFTASFRHLKKEEKVSPNAPCEVIKFSGLAIRQAIWLAVVR